MRPFRFPGQLEPDSEPRFPAGPSANKPPRRPGKIVPKPSVNPVPPGFKGPE